MSGQKLSTADLMITTVTLKSITGESTAGADRSVGHGIVSRRGRASQLRHFDVVNNCPASKTSQARVIVF